LEELEPAALENVILDHKRSGLRVLLGPASPEQGELITAQHVRTFVKYLAQLYDYVVVDCPTNYDERTLTVLDYADEIMLVTTPEVSAIKNANNFMMLASRMKLPLQKIHIVLNRADSNTQIGITEIEQILHNRVRFRINSSGRVMLRSLTRGVPVVLEHRDHPLAQQLMGIVATVMGESPAAGRGSEPKLLTKLASRSLADGSRAEEPEEAVLNPPRSRLQALWDLIWRWLTGSPSSA
jgi:pilus assembly protein CpaE